MNIPLKNVNIPFVFISSTKFTDNNCLEIVEAGRSRWKIENQGFNNQKCHGFYLQHVFCNDYIAMKNHYILIQIAHIIIQLMQKGMKIFKQYKKALKDISYDILESLRNSRLTPSTTCAKRLKINFKNTS